MATVLLLAAGLCMLAGPMGLLFPSLFGFSSRLKCAGAFFLGFMLLGGIGTALHDAEQEKEASRKAQEKKEQREKWVAEHPKEAAEEARKEEERKAEEAKKEEERKIEQAKKDAEEKAKWEADAPRREAEQRAAKEKFMAKMAAEQAQYEESLRAQKESEKTRIGGKFELQAFMIKVFPISMWNKRNGTLECYQVAPLKQDPENGLVPDHDKTSLLYTTKTRFTSPGNFTMRVERVEPTEVKLSESSGGFTQKWDTFVETQ